MAKVPRRVGMAIAVLAIGVSALPGGVRAQSDGLRRELEAMKQQLRQMQEQIKKQQELIDKLSAEKQEPKRAAPSVTAEATGGKSAEATAADEERLKRQITENIMHRLQPQLAAANKTFPSQFNPAIGLIIDTVGSYGSQTRGDFQFRAAELGVSASVDPFARGYAIITGSSSSGFDVEEAAIVTTSLPYNLTVKGGRFFADFGRLSKFHDHDLPFVNRPIVLDNYVGGESQSDGVEVNYLVPMKQYLTLTGGWYNKMGASNDRVDNTVSRDLSQFTYLGRAATFFGLSDANSVDLGGSWAYTPDVSIDDGGSRNLVGVDLTYRYVPLSQATYHGLIWGTELLYNQEDRPVGGFPSTSAQAASTSLARSLGVPTLAAETRGSPFALGSSTGAAGTPLVFKRRDSTGLYTYLEARLTQRYHPGFLFDYAQDIDHVAGYTTAYSPYLTVWLSEFQRLRLQYTRLEEPGNHENQFFLQWTVILGSHVHSFKDR
jgi:DNA-binding protein YbaB